MAVFVSLVTFISCSKKEIATGSVSGVLPYSATENLEAELLEPGLISYKRVAKNVTPLLIVLPQDIAEKFKKLAKRLTYRRNWNSSNQDIIIMEFMRQFPEVANFIKQNAAGAAIGIIVGTIVEDILTAGAGIGDDAIRFIVAYRIFRMGRNIFCRIYYCNNT